MLTSKERQKIRYVKWQKSDGLVRSLLVILWLLKILTCGFLFVCFIMAGAALLSPVPLILGLKFFSEAPFVDV